MRYACPQVPDSASNATIDSQLRFDLIKEHSFLGAIVNREVSRNLELTTSIEVKNYYEY